MDAHAHDETSLARRNSEETIQILAKKASPEQRDRILSIKERKQSLAEKKVDKHWNSCCLTADKDAIMYFTHAIVLTSLMTFSAIMLSQSTTCEEGNTWSSFLTMTIGLLIPAPKM